MTFVVTAGLLWGTGGLAGHLLQFHTGVTPLAVATSRLLFAGGLITLFLLVSGRLRRLPRSRPVMWRVVVNGCLHAVFQSLYFVSLALIPVGLATLVKIGSVPVFVALGISLVARRPPTRGLATSVLVAVVGLVLLAGFPSTDVSGWPLVGGLASSLGAGLAFSAMTVVNRAPVAGLAPIPNVGLGLLVGGVLLTPTGFVTDLSVPLAVEPLLLLGYLGLVPTVLAYLSYFAGLSRASDIAVAVGTISEPLTAAALSVVFLGEHLTVPGMIGTALLVLAMLGEFARPGR